MAGNKSSLDAIRSGINLLAGRRKVTIVAVSKGKSPQEIGDLYVQGMRDFGENRLDEALEKMRQCAELGLEGIVWHFIGTVQTNKAREVVENFDYIHSVDSDRLIGKISGLVAGAQNGAGARRHKPGFFIQVNISGEASKHGFSPDRAVEACACAAAKGLDLVGLMGIASSTTDEGKIEREYGLLDSLRQQSQKRLGRTLMMSAGMSSDYKSALRCGSDVLRVGRLLFE
ncbi:YggS family pyridoxal phosphate-dependent enzyme [Candidatus Parvarchaeota archaeon]|nr:YggS family pyridoxal phosphate-dependent enzyme [Candidatus Parvarchaeota archaeon]